MIVHTECYTLMNTDTRGNTDLFTHLLTVTMQSKHDFESVSCIYRSQKQQSHN